MLTEISLKQLTIEDLSEWGDQATNFVEEENLVVDCSNRRTKLCNFVLKEYLRHGDLWISRIHGEDISV
jgi:hypothetical protein